jgi:hypothetical protein
VLNPKFRHIYEVRQIFWIWLLNRKNKNKQKDLAKIA